MDRELDGPWEFRRALSDRWLPATVPGAVHLDLLAAGLIPDPYWRNAEAGLQWIEREAWEYRTAFRAGREALGHGRAELLFEGLDTYAEVRLNGVRLLEADNMFRPWRAEVTELLREGENELRVTFASPVERALPKVEALPYRLPAGNDRGDPPTSPFTRKAAYHYGWDWGARLVTSGIWKPARLVAWSGARLRDVHVEQRSLTEKRAELWARVEVEVAGPEPVEVRLRVRSAEGAFPVREARARPVEPGLQVMSVGFEIREPRRWWPNGLGEPHLYGVVVELEADGTLRDRAERRVGLRTLELVTEPDSIGESFFVRVNGVPVFAKGANWVPADHFPSRVDEDRYRRLFRDVVDAHMNMLRVWGGGIYEDDLFYELADEHGILVWQDFAFANALYPSDSAFLASVRAEAVHQVRRLRGHPSLALWCGNNEIREGLENWGWPEAMGWTDEEEAEVRRGYERLFEELLPEVVAENDPGRFYWPSSPSIGWGHAESLERGDSHYWGVWWGEEPFEVLRRKLPRFMSEFGFQAYPPLASIRAFTLPEDRAVDATVMRSHQKHPTGNETIRAYMARRYREPADFAGFVHLGQHLQAEGMRTAFEAHRRARPRTMGTLYWQLNDTWPVVSWSSLDWYGRPKMLHHAARRAFTPLLLSAVEEEDRVEVWAVNDGREAVRGELELELVPLAGAAGEALDGSGPAGRQGAGAWRERAGPAEVPAGAAVRLWVRPLAELLDGRDPAAWVLAARLLPVEDGGGEGDTGDDGGVALASALLAFRTPAELELFRAPVEARVEGPLPDAAAADGVRYRIELVSPVVALGVLLSLEEGPGEDRAAAARGPAGEPSAGPPDAGPPTGPAAARLPPPPPRFSDQGFDLLPGRPRVVWLTAAEELPDVAGRLRVRTVADAMVPPAATTSARESRAASSPAGGGR